MIWVGIGIVVLLFFFRKPIGKLYEQHLKKQTDRNAADSMDRRQRWAVEGYAGAVREAEAAAQKERTPENAGILGICKTMCKINELARSQQIDMQSMARYEELLLMQYALLLALKTKRSDKYEDVAPLYLKAARFLWSGFDAYSMDAGKLRTLFQQVSDSFDQSTDDAARWVANPVMHFEKDFGWPHEFGAALFTLALKEIGEWGAPVDELMGKQS